MDVSVENFMIGIYDNNYNLVKRYLENGGDPNVWQGEAIRISVQMGEYKFVKILLKYGANPIDDALMDAEENYIAAKRFSGMFIPDETEQILKILIKYGANIELLNDNNIKREMYRYKTQLFFPELLYNLENEYEDIPTEMYKQIFDFI